KKNTLAGNIFIGDPAILAAAHNNSLGALEGTPTNEDTTSANASAYIAALKQAYPASSSAFPAAVVKSGTLAGLANSVFTVNYYDAAWALDKALNAVHGDLSNGQSALHAALAKTSLPDAPYGPITLDQNRQAIVTNYIATVTPAGVHTSYAVPGVTQDFGGTFSPTTPSPGRGQPPCTKRSLPWQGKEMPASFQ
ncbi:MAG TPA: hypothetical protein VIX82_01555, partial [Solirubrobacteraceae bacterium]